MSSFAVAEETPPAGPARSGLLPRSPFLSVYELEPGAGAVAGNDPVREAFAALVDQLHDEEFDEALNGLGSQARAMHHEQLAQGTPREQADRLVMQHFAPLIHESEAAVDAMSREFAHRDEAGLVDREIESFVADYTPPNLDPQFEHFFGKLIKKVGRVAKAAVGTAWRGLRQVALGPLFKALRAALKPVLNRVLQKAIGRLPAPVQPAARLLAGKLGLSVATPAADTPAPTTAAPAPAAIEPTDTAVADSAGADSPTAQQELDERFASALLAHDEVELEMESAQAQMAAADAVPVFAELDDAREHFIQRLADLKDGEDPAPALENFLPAVLPALKLGVRLAGRQRVVNLLSGLMARLIGKLIGPSNAPALSRAIVDAGFKLLSLEAPSLQTAPLAASAVAATVEETVGRVAALPDEVLDQPELLEAFALEAFEQAAAANLPALFSQATYRQRPELLEAGVNVGWVMLPLRGPKRYKRCTRTFSVQVSPHMAGEVESFEGAPLSDHLHDRLGMPEGAEVDAQMHLFEALPGSSLADIVRGEKELLGPGLSDEAQTGLLHPLTPQAAAVLLGKPGLGRALPAGMNPHNLAAGQRLFHLAVAGRRPLTVHGRTLRRLLHINITLDGPQDRLRVCCFVSEAKAQKLALRLRDAGAAAALALGFRRWIGRRLVRAFSVHSMGRLRAVHPALPTGAVRAPNLAALPAGVLQTFAGKLQDVLVGAFAGFAKTQSQRFQAATQDSADGVTFSFEVENMPGMKALLQALADRGATASAVSDALAGATAPTVRVDVQAGHRCA